MKKIRTVVFALAITGFSTSLAASSSDEYIPTVKNIVTVVYIDGEKVEVSGIELTVQEIPLKGMQKLSLKNLSSKNFMQLLHPMLLINKMKFQLK